MNSSSTIAAPLPNAAVEAALPPVPRDISRRNEAALTAYRWATAPVRTTYRGYLRHCGRAPVLAFFYHHVGKRAVAPWSIDFATFRRQIDWLAARFDMVSLAEAQRRLAEGSDRPCAAITFDDGYAANCELALPYLISSRVPCTYFVSSWFVQTGTPFPHDVARGAPLAVNTPSQIRAFADAGVEIGGHTRTHHAFAPGDAPTVVHDEIIGGKHDLEAMIGKPVRYFAFPFGTPQVLTPQAIATVRQGGYAGYCSAYGGYNLPPADPFHLQRIHGDRSMARFLNWATLDPRKLCRSKLIR